MSPDPHPWQDPANAEAYAAFTHNFPMYADTSRDVADRAEVGKANRVVDLCCGTGVTTRTLLDRLPERAEVCSVDGSAAMLDVARTEITDPRVRWIHSPAEEFDRTLPDLAGQVDAVVCNSAIWQTELAATLRAVGRLLRPDGRLVFNVGSRFIRRPDQDQAVPPPGTEHLGELMRRAAIEEFGYQPPVAVRRRTLLTPESIQAGLAHAGLEQHTAELIDYPSRPAMTRAWLQVPIFADTVCPGLPYEQQLQALELAAERYVEPATPAPAPWYVVVARPARR
ncbi:class I SAM-dependent methyltransferase [Microlunatus speluncae]|uniref:class I SAM-dependent methyltransferase n=1 Tax=Microlunatus speluncae TaxID=2594267 RepID=UPI0013763AE5|nr:class I SAM-dependent methyltransferase [Microlunatus speluncae]